MSSSKILIVDDHEIFGKALAALLDKKNALYNVVGVVQNGQEAIDFVQQNKVDIVILDINMPKIDGITTIQRVNSSHPAFKIIVLTNVEDQEVAKTALLSGAYAYLLKNASVEELLFALDTIKYGNTFFYNDISKEALTSGQRQSETLESYVSEGIGNQKTDLTVREFEILKLIAQDFSTKEIADKLYISSRTVEVHKRNLKGKLNVKSSNGLVMYYYQHCM